MVTKIIKYVSVGLFLAFFFLNRLSVSYAQSCTLKNQGDANCDGKVDLIDYESWRREFLALLTTKASDFNNDGRIDLVDYESWRRTYVGGTSNPTPTSTTDVCNGKQSSGPISISNQSNVVIECKSFTDLGPNVIAISLDNVSNVTIKNNDFTRISEPIYIQNSRGPIIIQNNNSVDVTGPHQRDGSNRANFVQFNDVWGRMDISNNVIDGGDFEDAISLFAAGGTSPTEPLWVHHNRIRGCRPGGLCWSSASGSGVMAGDLNGRYVLVEKNIFVNAGQVGIGIASGQDIIVRNNVMFQEAAPKSNVGIYVWNQYSNPCSNHTIENNRVRYIQPDGSPNGFWDGGNCSGVTVSGNNWNDTTLDASLWNKSFAELGL